MASMQGKASTSVEASSSTPAFVVASGRGFNMPDPFNTRSAPTEPPLSGKTKPYTLTLTPQTEPSERAEQPTTTLTPGSRKIPKAVHFDTYGSRQGITAGASNKRGLESGENVSWGFDTIHTIANRPRMDRHLSVPHTNTASRACQPILSPARGMFASFPYRRLSEFDNVNK
jgi:hypothetical protein